MLVITRKVQEKVHIGDHITITVVRVKGKAVRLGIEAPKEVRVMRGELAEAMAMRDQPAEMKDSATSNSTNGSTEAGGDGLSTASGLHGRVSEMMSRRKSLEKPVEAAAALPMPATASGFTDPMRLRRPLRMGPSTLRSIASWR